MTDPTPNFPYVAFQMIKKSRAGEPKVETHYLNVRSCHGNAETLAQMVREKKKILGYGNLDQLNKGVAREIANFVDGITGNNLDPLLRTPSVMETRVEKAKRERAADA